jgi:hypothetical protein
MDDTGIEDTDGFKSYHVTTLLPLNSSLPCNLNYNDQLTSQNHVMGSIFVFQLVIHFILLPCMTEVHTLHIFFTFILHIAES